MPACEPSGEPLPPRTDRMSGTVEEVNPIRTDGVGVPGHASQLERHLRAEGKWTLMA